MNDILNTPVLSDTEKDTAVAAVGRVIDRLQEFGAFRSDATGADLPRIFEEVHMSNKMRHPDRAEDFLLMDTLVEVTQHVLNGYHSMRVNLGNDPWGFAIRVSEDLGRDVTSDDLIGMLEACGPEFKIVNEIMATTIQRATEKVAAQAQAQAQQKREDDEIIFHLEGFFKDPTTDPTTNQ